MKSISRRQFIASTTAVAAAPLILPSRAWGANDRISMGFIGMGKQSRGLLRGFLFHPDVQVLAVCEVDTNRREAARSYVDAHYGNHSEGAPGPCAAYTNLRDLIARNDIDAVCIATPDHWHAYPTVEALKSGKDVYCEKPLTHNIHEAVEVMRAVKANRGVLQTGSMQRSSREFRLACELVRGGAIGEISEVHCNFGPPGVPCDLPAEEMEPGLDWNMWIGPGPMRPYSSVLSPRGLHDHFPDWRSYKEYGGGMVCDWGAHHLDIAQWGLDMDDSGPVKVTPPEDHNATQGAVLTYKNGVRVVHGGAPKMGVEFTGAKGKIHVDRGQFEVELDGEILVSYAKYNQESREPGFKLSHALDKAEEIFGEDEKERLYVSDHHLKDFVDCVKARKKPVTNEQVGGRSAICCHLMNQAYYNHAEIEWNPRALRFPRNSGNPEWLTRKYRGPWVV